MLWQNLKHIDLREIAARVSPENQRTGKASKKPYVATAPGMADLACVGVAYALKDLWARGDRDVRLAEIEAHRDVRSVPSGDALSAGAVKRLKRMGQVKLDFDREGVIIRQGRNWIETDP